MTSATTSSSPRRELGSTILLASWFALVTGTFEGAGALVFERINRANWGRVSHVSGAVIWVAPIVDFAVFILFAAALIVVSRLYRRMQLTRTALFIYAFLMAFAWLNLTGRIALYAVILLAFGVSVAIARWFGKHQENCSQFCRLSLPVLLAILILGIGLTAGRNRWTEHRAIAKLPPASPNSPNVLVIVIDTLRADHVSAYGYPRITTPNIDRFAGEGVLFENAIAPSSWTLPSHASMLTGRYSFEHQADNVKPMWPPSQAAPTLHTRYPTMGEIFQQHGYRTAAFTGNRVYFLRQLGLARGFSHFADFKADDMILRTVFGRKLLKVARSRRLKAISQRLGSHAYRLYQDFAFAIECRDRKRGFVTNSSISAWLDRSPDKPFFIFVNYYDVHSPYVSINQKFSHGSKNQVDRYDDGVADTDEYVGDLLRELKRRGLDKSTVVILTSDHGELLG